MKWARKIRVKYTESHGRARCSVVVMLKVYFALLVLYLNETIPSASLSGSMLVRRKDLKHVVIPVHCDARRGGQA